jgi:AmmeMemoRadiSam system protein A
VTVLTTDQQRALLDIARDAIEAAVRSGTGRPGGPAVAGAADLPAASGVFVTIKRRGELRGCLGTLENRLGLAIEVARCAVESAREDPRFPPVTVDELDELALEISVLGPLERIEAVPGAFTVGVHGLVVQHGFRRGLLLPQVAVEWSWTAEQFLRQTCVKAGLPVDAWLNGATVYRFSAQVFRE